MHGIGAGILLAEIQENSDVTYRVYDYGRKDEKGNPRALHVEQALKVLNLQDVSDGRLPHGGRESGGNFVRPLAADEHFLSESVTYRHPADGSVHAGFQIAIVTRGAGRLTYAEGAEELHRGAVVLLPAGFNHWKVVPGQEPLTLLWAWIAEK